MTKTSEARTLVGIPPRINLTTLRSGYTWLTPLCGRAFIEYDAGAERWDWSIDSEENTGVRCGKAKYLHRALTKLDNADANRYADEHMATDSPF